MDGRNINLQKARRQATARVRARLKREQKLPGYNQNRRRRKSKKSKNVLTGTEQPTTATKPPWNDRFFAKETDQIEYGDDDVNRHRGHGNHHCMRKGETIYPSRTPDHQQLVM